MEDHNRDRIIEETMQLFNHRGYKNVTMREIAKLLGMSSKTLYHYFPSKEAIAEAAIMLLRKNVSAGIQAVQHSEADPISKLKEVLTLIRTEIITTNPLLLRDIEHYAPNIWEKFYTGKDEYIQMIREFICEGQNTGLIKKTINPEVAAHVYTSIFRAVIDPAIFNNRGYSTQDMMDFLIDIFFDGVCEKL